METYANILIWVIIIFMSIILLLAMCFLIGVMVYVLRGAWNIFINEVEPEEPFEGMYK
jgi:uncharacterized protein involved in cysteine biosynthesis